MTSKAFVPSNSSRTGNDVRLKTNLYFSYFTYSCYCVNIFLKFLCTLWLNGRIYFLIPFLLTLRNSRTVCNTSTRAGSVRPRVDVCWISREPLKIQPSFFGCLLAHMSSSWRHWLIDDMSLCWRHVWRQTCHGVTQFIQTISTAINSYGSVTDSNKIYSDDRVWPPEQHFFVKVIMWLCGDTSWRHHHMTMSVTLRLLCHLSHLW